MIVITIYILTRILNYIQRQIRERWVSSPYPLEWESNNYNPYLVDSHLDTLDWTVYRLPRNHILSSLQYYET